MSSSVEFEDVAEKNPIQYAHYEYYQVKIDEKVKTTLSPLAVTRWDAFSIAWGTVTILIISQFITKKEGSHTERKSEKTMEGSEIKKFLMVWLIVAVSLCYCYAISKIVPKGFARLLAILPVLCLFLALPLNLTSFHLCFITAFFISWLSIFKLLLFAFGLGPLCSDPLVSLARFIVVGCLPIKIQQGLPPKTQQLTTLLYPVKLLMLVICLRAYDYSTLISTLIHPHVMRIFTIGQIYFTLEFTLAIFAALPRAVLGLELEQQFNEPYISTSLQEFWGRRWNIMVTSILKPTVYLPVFYFCSRFMGQYTAIIAGVLSTFLVSGIMHELLFYYLEPVNTPNGKFTCFFLLNGVLLAVEIIVKKINNNRYKLHPLVSGFIAVGSVMVTGMWLFVPEFLRVRGDTRAVEEYVSIGMFAKDTVCAVTFRAFDMCETNVI